MNGRCKGSLLHVCLLFLSILSAFDRVFLFSGLLSFPSGIMVPRATVVLTWIHLVFWTRLRRNWSVCTD